MLALVALAGPAWGHDEASQHGAAGGRAGDPRKVSRTIDVAMTDDMRFTPALITVRRGETVRFRVKNAGQVEHEMVLGDLHDLEAHAKVMRDNPGMHHADANQATVAPGRTGELVWQFPTAGTFDFACLQPGHFEAGMRGRIVVRP